MARLIHAFEEQTSPSFIPNHLFFGRRALTATPSRSPPFELASPNIPNSYMTRSFSYCPVRFRRDNANCYASKRIKLGEIYQRTHRLNLSESKQQIKYKFGEFRYQLWVFPDKK